ncbi:MAG: acyltransferase [Fibrobacter sp.]|nr:acyltransferase [Fibrobacter sp.]
MQKRIQELDVLRVVAMLFVITYHFGCEYAAARIPFFNLFYLTPNYDFGNIAVTIFIALSGGLLYKKYGVIGGTDNAREQFKTFYLKRVKAIYPPFWILSLYIPLSIIRHALSDGNAFAMGHPLALFLTVVGFDGYFKIFGFNTYAFCGDWFVGAIVLLYLLYPLLAKCYRSRPTITLLTLTGLYAAQFLLSAKYNDVLSALPATLALKFCIGFTLIENLERLRNWRVAGIAGFSFIVLTFINIPGCINTDALGTFAAFALFAIIFYAAPFLLRFNTISKPIQKLAALSYCVFLVQHVGIIWAQAAFIKIFEKMHWNFSEWISIALLVCTLTAIMIAAWVLKRVSDKIVHKVAG